MATDGERDRQLREFLQRVFTREELTGFLRDHDLGEVADAAVETSPQYHREVIAALNRFGVLRYGAVAGGAVEGNPFFGPLSDARANERDRVCALASLYLEGPDPADVEADDRAEAAYLRALADRFHDADFKGIEQFEKFIVLKLDDIFVDLRVAPDDPRGDHRDRADALRDALDRAHPAERERLEAELMRLDAGKSRPGDADGLSLDRVLARPGAVVLLGGPGSGKTTLIKRLARSLALGPETARARFPELPWVFPVVVPIATFAALPGEPELAEVIAKRLTEAGGPPLLRAFRRRWDAGECVVLLDGLDEVADTGRRIWAARQVDRLIPSLGPNRLVVTSRPVGYSVCQVGGAREHVRLLPLRPGDVATFVRQWSVAYDRAVRPETADPARAEADAAAMVEEVESNPRVQALATNPLMLTIVALIRNQIGRLPERRVELYEIALNTLMRSWDRARSLTGLPIGDELSLEDAKEVWGWVAFWLHKEKDTGTCRRAELHGRVVKVLRKLDPGLSLLKAQQTAESYIEAASRRSGLLEEKGANTFGFLHQTFEEYLAARHLATHGKVIPRVLELAADPRWHEVIRLTAGFIGVHQADKQKVSRLVESLMDEASHPLEPILYSNLRLAALCVADDVRVRQATADQVVVRIARTLNTPHGVLLAEQCAALAGMRAVIPGPDVVASLKEMAFHSDWRVRMESARLLARAGGDSPAVRTLLEQLLKDGDGHVAAHAALGLWNAGVRDDRVSAAVLFGVGRTEVGWFPVPVLEFSPYVCRLLEHADPGIRLRAARVLSRWGRGSEAAPAVAPLLKHENPYVKLGAAELLGGWGRASEAAAAVALLLEYADTSVRVHAAWLFDGWGRGSEAAPAVARLLEHEDPNARLKAAEVLSRWGRGSEAAPAVARLLEHADNLVRSRAAEVLSGWKRGSEAAPAVAPLLGHADPDVRLRAAALLGGWGRGSEAAPAVAPLLGHADPDVRLRAAALLGSWGAVAEATPVVARLLEGTDDFLRHLAARNFRNGGIHPVVVRSVLSYLRRDDLESLVEFLTRANRGKSLAALTPALAEALVDVVTGRPEDSVAVEACRGIVFAWLWKASRRGD